MYVNRLPELLNIREPIPFGRMEGRSTAIALRLLSAAITNRGKPVVIEDHVGTVQAREHTAQMIRDIAEKLDLKAIEVKHLGRGVLAVQSNHIVHT